MLAKTTTITRWCTLLATLFILGACATGPRNRTTYGDNSANKYPPTGYMQK